MRYSAFLAVAFLIPTAQIPTARADDSTATPNTIPLTSLDIAAMSQEYGTPKKNLTVEKHPLSIGGQKFENGVGTHANSRLTLDLDGSPATFHASVGVDDEVHKQGTVDFKVVGDRKVLWDSGIMKGGDAAKTCDVKLDGVKRLALVVEDGGDGITADHADWCDAKFTTSGGSPKIVVHQPSTQPYILTPPPPPSPRINSAKVFGVRPGNPFMYTIAATGDRPMTFSADDLPSGLTLDKETGQITGTLDAPAESRVTLHAKNAVGEVTSPFKIVCGPTIALTPAMGWNSWNCWAGSVSDEKVRAAADAFVSKGLINHGWTYVNIDDVWERRPNSDDPIYSGPLRDDKGFILPNKKFPDMKALADYVHSKGLKIGLYSSPGPTTCGGYAASYQHEDQDAQSWAQWGFDYIKYDWCSYGGIAPHPDLEAMLQKPYRVLRASLDKQKRDINFSFCQYGMGKVWEWGADAGGNSWRTTGDINDSWSSLSSIGFSQDGHEKFAGPGHWNDPDMLVVGHVGWGPALHPSHLTPDEQYTHISLWCLLSSPLLIGCDLNAMDDFTMNLLTNDEVLAIDQDPLGKPAGRIVKEDYAQVWARDLEDGSKAVGLFNLDEDPQEVVVKWSDLKLSGPLTVHDLWRQKDLGQFNDEYKATVPPHGVVLIKVHS